MNQWWFKNFAIWWNTGWFVWRWPDSILCGHLLARAWRWGPQKKSPTKILDIFHVCWPLSPEKSWLNSLCNISWCILLYAHFVSCIALLPQHHCIPGHAVSGGCGVLALHAVASSPSPDPGGARGGPILTKLIHTGLPRHVEPHGLLVVDMDALSGWHITLSRRGVNQLLLLLNQSPS